MQELARRQKFEIYFEDAHPRACVAECSVRTEGCVYLIVKDRDRRKHMLAKNGRGTHMFSTAISR